MQMDFFSVFISTRVGCRGHPKFLWWSEKCMLKLGLVNWEKAARGYQYEV